jgi:UDP-perosamine 4-acetyltransferase
MVGEDVHIAPGVTVSGNVLIEDGVHIGTGASIIQGVTIGRETVIGAGTVVVKSVPEYSKLIGIKPRLKTARNESDL